MDKTIYNFYPLITAKGYIIVHLNIRSFPKKIDQLHTCRSVMAKNRDCPSGRPKRGFSDMFFSLSKFFMSFGIVCLFVCGISLTSGQLFNELFPDCTRSCFSQVVLRCRGGDRIYEMRCLFVAVGPNARFIVLPHWDNMS